MWDIYTERTAQEYRFRSRATNGVLNHGSKFDSISHILILPFLQRGCTAVNDTMGDGERGGEVNAIRQDSWAVN